MAKPRIFISSTFYDLEQHRADLEEFIKEMGYEPVLSERGDISYGKDDYIEEYCYKEAEDCDMLIALIGGKFGSPSRYGSSSITQKEIETALEKNKQVYIFIKKEIDVEFNTYKLNKDKNEVIYSYVDNKKIFDFIEDIKDLKKNNPIFTFETMKDVKICLKKQWAGLFYDFLNADTHININEELIMQIREKPEESGTDIEENTGFLLNGEFLHIKSWRYSEGNEKFINTDIDGDGIKETIIFGRLTQIGTKLQVLMGKDIFELCFDIKGLDEFGECGGRCEVAIKDVTNDGFPEILFAFFGTDSMAVLNIFKFDKQKYLKTPRGEQLNPFEMISYLSGQTEFRILNGGKIEIPYGGQGFYETYSWNGKKFMQEEFGN